MYYVARIGYLSTICSALVCDITPGTEILMAYYVILFRKTKKTNMGF